MKNKYLRSSLLLTLVIFAFSSCKKDDAAEQTKPSLRPAIDYTKVTETTKYDNTNTIFVDATGASTIDLTTGNTRYKIFQAINTYTGTASTTLLDVNVLKNMYSNTNSPFTGTFVALNGTGIDLRSATAASYATADANTVRTRIETNFQEMVTVSAANAATATIGVAGKLGTRMVDAKGMETAQIIQKSLIGALQLDYIGNVLLTTGLDADNYTLVSGKKYTKLEQNWDEAYGMLTLNPVYLAGSTDAVRGTTESFLGSYVWEYNKTNYAKIHMAFLKGRAAIVNNDMTEVKAQATFIKTQFELAIANAAVGYLGKWATRSGATGDADRAHDIGEGGGFIYSLRFCKINGADAAFSDGVLTALLNGPNGFWDITPAKIAAATASIKTKFKLP